MVLSRCCKKDVHIEGDFYVCEKCGRGCDTISEDTLTRKVKMNPESRHKLKNLLVQHVKFHQFPYTNVNGHLTIGLGRNLSDRGISPTEAIPLLDDDIFYFMGKLSHHLPFFDEMNDVRKIILINMCFDLGVRGVLECTDLLRSLKNKEWEETSREILKLKAAEISPEWYQLLAFIMKSGEI